MKLLIIAILFAPLLSFSQTLVFNQSGYKYTGKAIISIVDYTNTVSRGNFILYKSNTSFDIYDYKTLSIIGANVVIPNNPTGSTTDSYSVYFSRYMIDSDTEWEKIVLYYDKSISNYTVSILDDDNSIILSEKANYAWTYLIDNNTFVEFNFPDGSKKIYKFRSDIVNSVESTKPTINEITINSFPNPFNGNNTLTLELLKPTILNIQVYDILGRSMVNLTNLTATTGINQYSIDFSNFSSGEYIYHITDTYSNQIIYRKVTHIK